MKKRGFYNFGSLDDRKCEELHSEMVSRNRQIQKDYKLAEKQSNEDMKKLKKQQIAAMKRIKQTCKEQKSLISYYSQLSC